jgi:hypothetical protein
MKEILNILNVTHAQGGFNHIFKISWLLHIFWSFQDALLPVIYIQVSASALCLFSFCSHLLGTSIGNFRHNISTNLKLYAPRIILQYVYKPTRCTKFLWVDFIVY